MQIGQDHAIAIGHGDAPHIRLGSCGSYDGLLKRRADGAGLLQGQAHRSQERRSGERRMLRHWIELLFIGLFHAAEQRLKTLGLHRSRNQKRQGGKAKTLAHHKPSSWMPLTIPLMR